MGRVKIMIEGEELIRCDTCEEFDHSTNMYEQVMESGNKYYHCSICQDNYNIVCDEIRKDQK